MRKAILAASTALLCAGTAMAGELSVVKKDDALTDGMPRWAGTYFGAIGGYTFGKAVDRDYNPVTLNVRAETPVTEVKGGTYGGYAGFNWQAGNLVYGAEIGFNGSDADGAWHPDWNPAFAYSGNEVSHEVNWFGGLTGRAGYATGRMLYYALFGIVVGNDTTTLSYITDDVPDWSESNKKTHTGWTIGGGFEYAINDYISTRVEFSHVDFVTNGDQDLYYDTIRFGVTYKMAQ